MCALTGLVIVNSGAWTQGLNGASLSRAAFADIPVIGPIVLTVGLVTFVFATILGWAYYGEKAAEYLFGTRAVRPYRVLWVIAVMVGSVVVAARRLVVRRHRERAHGDPEPRLPAGHDRRGRGGDAHAPLGYEGPRLNCRGVRPGPFCDPVPSRTRTQRASMNRWRSSTGTWPLKAGRTSLPTPSPMSRDRSVTRSPITPMRTARTIQGP